MKPRRRQFVLILAALASVPAVGLDRTAVQPAQPAAWVTHDVSIDLRDLPRRYSCDELWQKFHDVLRVLGARPDLKILTERCEQASRSARVRLQFSTPELVKRTALPGKDIEAAAAIIRLEPGHPASLTVTDCELVRQMKDRLLAPLSQRIVSYNLACAGPASSGARFNVSVQALQPFDNRARIAEEGVPLLKQPAVPSSLH